MDQIKNTIQYSVNSLILQMNAIYNVPPETVKWTTMKGVTIRSRFMYVLSWKIWKTEALSLETKLACENWESIFGKDECAKMALESKVNWRMSALARKQAALWIQEHPKEVKAAEIILANEFFAMQPEYTASNAISFADDETQSVEPNVKARAMCWMRLNPDQVKDARDELDLSLANEFIAKFPDNPALKCFQILHEMSTTEDVAWAAHANHYKNFNSEQYKTVEKDELSRLAAEFKVNYPANTPKIAAKIIENNSIAQMTRDEDIYAELASNLEIIYGAKSWAFLNQGIYRAGLRAIKEENASRAVRQWNELSSLTEDFTKGSHVHVSAEARENTALDRFFVFRERMYKRFSWLLAYYYKRQNDLTLELQELLNNDPSDKLLHNVRPSEAEKTKSKMISQFIYSKTTLLDSQSELFQRLSTWNIYFGLGG